MNIQNKTVKNKAGLLLSALCLVGILVFIGILTATLIVRPESISLSSDVNVVCCNNEVSYFGGTDGKIEKRDKNGDIVLFQNLENNIVLMEKFGSGLAVATENRQIYLLDQQGEVTASAQINYNPSGMYVSEGKLYVAAKTKVKRNRIYCFDENLQLQDLTKGVSHSERNENESDIIYNERVNSLFLDIPVAAVGYFPENEKLYVLSSFGIISTYNSAGELVDLVGLDYNPIDGQFLSNGMFVVLDDVGGFGVYNSELEPMFYYEEYNKRNQALAVSNDSMIVSDIYGNLTQLDFTGNILLEQSLKGKIENIYLTDSGDFFIWNESASVVNEYDWNRMPQYVLYRVLFYISIVMAAFALVSTILFALAVFNNRRYQVVAKYSKSIGKRLIKSKFAYLLLLPTLLLCIIFAYYPAFQGLILAFFEVDIGGVNVFIGMKNFQDLLSKSYFWSGMGNMLIFLFTDILKGLIPSFIFAQLIIAMRSSKAQYLTRVLLYIPGIIPGVAALLMWQNGIFGNEGLLNGIITAFGGEAVNFLGKEGVALSSLIFFGFPWIGNYIILYGALMGIPKSFYDAAKLDGCSWGKRLLMIDLPLISPQLKYIFVITFIGSVQDFQRVYLTTEGAAGTYVPMLEMYYNLTKFDNLGMAAAMGLILFGILLIATLVNLKLKTVDSYE